MSLAKIKTSDNGSTNKSAAVNIELSSKTCLYLKVKAKKGLESRLNTGVMLKYLKSLLYMLSLGLSGN